jgi:hypothetical protein
MTIGYIYKIQPTVEHQPNEIYIGSTTKTINQRLSNHKSDYGRYLNGKYNNVSVFKLFDKFGINNMEIVLLQEIEFEDKKQLTDLEGQYIRDNDCVNKNIMGRNKKEWSEIYYKNNKNKFIEQHKKYIENNKNHIQEYKKRYQTENKIKLNEKAKQNHICNVCNGKYTHQGKSQHYKSLKHQKALNNQPIININIENVIIN